MYKGRIVEQHKKLQNFKSGTKIQDYITRFIFTDDQDNKCYGMQVLDVFGGDKMRLLKVQENCTEGSMLLVSPAVQYTQLSKMDGTL